VVAGVKTLAGTPYSQSSKHKAALKGVISAGACQELVEGNTCRGSKVFQWCQTEGL
jgi:hypothetical protein